MNPVASEFIICPVDQFMEGERAVAGGGVGERRAKGGGRRAAGDRPRAAAASGRSLIGH